MTNANNNDNAAQTPAVDEARWERYQNCDCNAGCNICDPAPADWYAVEIVNGPRATGSTSEPEVPAPSADPRTRYADAITAYRRAERRVQNAAQHRDGVDCGFPGISAERFCLLARVESGISGELTPAEWADAAERVAARFCRSADEFCQLVA